MVKEESKAPEKEIKKEGNTIVVEKVPQVDARIFKDNDGTEHSIVTRDEALAEILEKIRELYKHWK